MSVPRRLLVACYLIDAGLLLIIVPWTSYWQHNYFAGLVPALGPFMTNAFVRGGVSGIGLITTAAGIRDLISVMFARHAERPAPSAPDTAFR